MPTAQILDIPESDSDRCKWLESQLVGTRLGQLASELRLIGQLNSNQPPPVEASVDLDAFLGDQKEQVLDAGLESLAPEKLQQLLQKPRLLMDLQELVLIDGGGYWDKVATRVFESGQRSTNSLDQPDAQILDAHVDAAVSPSLSSESRRRWVWSAIAIAAALLAMVTIALNRNDPNEKVAWGFLDPEMTTGVSSSPEYFGALASAANEWFNVRASDPQTLRVRLDEFSEGCALLIEANHEPLSKIERTWLVWRCGQWKSKIDALRTDLAGDPMLFQTTKVSADELVTQLVVTLKTKADQAQS